jgi:flagellar hook assembly protein FlgD
VTLDTPQGGRAYADFMKIGNSVMKQGASIVRFGVAKAGRVQVNIYDVAGRKVRGLADRVFPAGEHTLQWDGTDDAGGKVARGVYFVRSSVQKDTGRIIVLNN